MRRDGDEVPADTGIVEIKVGDLVVGEVDPRTLKAKALFDLERTATGLGLISWLETYAGLGAKDRPAVEAEIGEMSLGALAELALAIGEAIGAGLRLPNGSKRGSSRR